MIVLHAASQVQDSNVFHRDGFDIHSDVHISFTQAVLGGEVRTAALSGPIMVKVWYPLDTFGLLWSLTIKFCSPRFRLGLHHTTRYDLPTGESPDSIAMATVTTMFTSR